MFFHHYYNYQNEKAHFKLNIRAKINRIQTERERERKNKGNSLFLKSKKREREKL